MSMFYCEGHQETEDSDLVGHNVKNGKEYCDNIITEEEYDEQYAQDVEDTDERLRTDYR